MKKFIILFSIFGILFVTNKVYSALFIACTVGGDCPTQTYSCGGNTYKDYNSYQNCIQTEQAEKERLENEAKQKLFNERTQILSAYKDFFVKVGVNLTLDTGEEQYNQWLKELKESKTNHLKEQENLQKIIELEERINNLESKPVVVEKVITPTEGINTRHKEEIMQPKTNNKIIEPIVKQEEPQMEIIKETPSPIIIETPTTTETPVITTNKTFFQRVFSWFKSLL